MDERMNRWCNQSYKHTLRNDMIRQLFPDMRKDLNVSNLDSFGSKLQLMRLSLDDSY